MHKKLVTFYDLSKLFIFVFFLKHCFAYIEYDKPVIHLDTLQFQGIPSVLIVFFVPII